MSLLSEATALFGPNWESLPPDPDDWMVWPRVATTGKIRICVKAVRIDGEPLYKSSILLQGSEVGRDIFKTLQQAVEAQQKRLSDIGVDIQALTGTSLFSSLSAPCPICLTQSHSHDGGSLNAKGQQSITLSCGCPLLRSEWEQILALEYPDVVLPPTLDDWKTLDKMIAGAIKDQIRTHGPIGTREIPSAVKRVRGALKNWLHNKGQKARSG